MGYEVLAPEPDFLAEVIHAAIYDPAYGIKAQGTATPRARQDLLRGVTQLREAGAEVVVLGCTEIPLALPEPVYEGTPLLDTSLILARALIRAVDEGRLRPWPPHSAG